MHRKHHFLLGAIIVLVLAFILALSFNENDDRIEVQVGDVSVRAEVADEAEEREVGLSGRAHLADGEGMLFVFEEPDLYGFWMKGMQFPLDIIWVDESKTIIGVSEGVSPDTFPQNFFPSEPVLYVLEVPSGFSAANGLTSGQSLNFDL